MIEERVRKDPIFIVGVGRSGTTLVQSMLASHSRLAFPPETGFLRRFVLSGKLERVARREGWRGVAREMREDDRLARLDLDIDELVRCSADDKATGADLYERILNAHASRVGKPWSGDKDPRLIEYLPYISARWPDAHIVHVIRDPRDVLASKKRAAWSSDRSSARHIFANAVQAQLGFRWGERLFGAQYHEVVYERLLTEPEAELRSLCHALGLEFEPEMLAFWKAARNLVSASEMGWKREALGPLQRDNAGKWRTRLTGAEVALTERLCHETFRRAGYVPAGAMGRPSLMRRMGLTFPILSAAAAATLFRIYRGWTSRRAITRGREPLVASR